MVILAFDTTSEHGGAGIYRNHECLAVQGEPEAGSYSIALFQRVDRLLRETSLSLRDIDLFAVANGPGAFTGIRVGLAAALAWGNALDRPVRGVSVLAALVEKGQPATGCAIPILDARRGEFYAGRYKRVDAAASRAYNADGESVLLNPLDLRKYVSDRVSASGRVTCLVRAPDRSADDLRAGLRELPVEWLSIPGDLVGGIARVALAAHRAGNPPTSSELDACYIRRTDAELNWRG